MTAGLTQITVFDSTNRSKPFQSLDISGTGIGPYVSMVTVTDDQGNVIAPAKDLTVGALGTQLGTIGGSPPTLPGSSTGVMGLLRFIASLLPASIGQKVMAASLPVVVASDNVITTKLEDGSGNAIGSTSGALNVNISSGGGSGGVTAGDETSWVAGTSQFAPTGGVYNDSATNLSTGQEGTFRSTTARALHTNLRTANGTELGGSAAPLQVSLANTATNAVPVKVDASGVAVPVTGTFWQTTQPVSGTFWQTTQPVSQSSGPWTVNVTQVAGGGIAQGPGVASAAIRTFGATATTGTQTSVAASATDVTILASNANRFSATVFNDSTSAILYLLLATGTSSTSNYSVQIPAGGYFELGFPYTGVLKGLWSAATGNARVTEFTA